MPKLKFSKEYLQRATKPIPKKEPGKKDETGAEVQSQPRHATGFTQYCGTCARNQMFKVDTLAGRPAPSARAGRQIEARAQSDRSRWTREGLSLIHI